MPVKLEYRATPIRLDTQKAANDLLRLAQDWWKENILSWSEGVLSMIQPDHVATGMTATSIAPLLDRLGEAGQWFRGDPEPNRWVKDIDGSELEGVEKTPELGYEWGKDAFVVQMGSIKDLQLVFEYDMVIFQMLENHEEWGVKESGIESFKLSAEMGFRKMQHLFATELKLSVVATDGADDVPF